MHLKMSRIAAKKAVCNGSDVQIHHYSGFFSCCSVTLRSIIEFIKSNDVAPIIIDVNDAFNEYKKASQSLSVWFVDPKHSIGAIIKGPNTFTPSSHDIFQHWFENDPYVFDVNAFQFIINTYFKPNSSMIELKNQIKVKYGINPSQTLFLYYRGTDKVVEMSHTPVDIMIEKCREVNNDLSILVQSDEPTFVERVRNEFPDVKQIEELEARGHEDLEERHIHSRYLLASALIASECNSIVMTTGNVSLWMFLYRGHNKNVYQYHHAHNKEIGDFLRLEDS
jgi:hypothetical protein